MIQRFLVVNMVGIEYGNVTNEEFMKDVAQYECFYNLYKNKNKYANRWEIIGEKLIGGEGRGQRSTLCQKHEALSPVCGKPQVLVSS